MNLVLIRFATAVAASCGLIGGYLAFPAAAATPAPVPPAHIITVPSPEEVTDTVDASHCPWLLAYAATVAKTATPASDAHRQAMRQETTASYATLLKVPLVAALCGMAGH
ncbi:hypothetical protein ABH926_008826 [Catenulispora sp. GP43]|uniref:hypothetical protein n=1 Tax=Catenulispora sp. GP43 TaxID=3156263 RepID=UPI003512BC22